MNTIAKYSFPSEGSHPEFYQGARSELLDRRNRALSVLQNSKGKTIASRAERQNARLELASVYDLADTAGIFIGQEEPSPSARNDLNKMNEAMMDDFAQVRAASRRPPNLEDPTKLIATRTGVKR